ncbi:MAG: hypothetical protein ACE5EX_10620, partial [Phycisphaerae bacterium]
PGAGMCSAGMFADAMTALRLATRRRGNATRLRMTTVSAIRELFAELIDYAGLFPPARLPIEEALRNFAAYRSDRYAWILGRFVCPTTTMADLASGAVEIPGDVDHAGGDAAPWRLSALGRSGADERAFVHGVEADVEAILELMTARAGRVVVDSLETKLPADVMASCREGGVAKTLMRVAGTVDRIAPMLAGNRPRVFLEVALDGDWRAGVGGLAKAVHRVNQERGESQRPTRLGLKIRTGGVKASMIPPLEQVAFLIHRCRDEGVSFKATAGLHHPLRRDAPEVGAKMHGFVNLFGAAVMAHSRALSEGAIREMLADESSGAFRLDDDGLTWRDHHASAGDIAAARANLAVSFGSCSVDEPVDDSKRLGFLR